MENTQKQSSSEHVQSRIERMKAAQAVYEKALRTGQLYGKRLSSEDREYLRGELEDLAFYIRKEARTSRGAA